jgi:hypothetical protein
MLTDGLIWNQYCIPCERGHIVHETVLVPIELAADPNPVTFDLEVYRSHIYKNTDPPTWCHGDDGVATGIIGSKTWETFETRLVLDIFANEQPGLVLDFGTNFGWYTVIAGLLGHDVIGFEMEPETMAVCQRNVDRAGLTDKVTLHQCFVDDEMPRLHADADVLLVKADVESHEFGVVEACWDLLRQKRIQYMLLEISPCFRPGYAALLASVVALGYEAFVVPDCQSEGREVFEREPLVDLRRRPVKDPEAFVEYINQRNVLMVRR